MSKITFQSDNITIHGTLILPEQFDEPVPGVIIFHGMTSSEVGYIPLAQRLAEIGIAGLAISMRGHGESAGDFNKATVAEAINDGMSAYDFLASLPEIDERRIGLVGSSVGAILASMTSEKRSVKSLVFRAPAAYTQEMMQLSMAGTMVDEDKQFHEIDDLGDTPAGSAVGKYDGNLLIVASEKDTLIPLSVPQSYLKIARHTVKKSLFIIEGATHRLTEHTWKESFTRETLKWFSETL